MLRLEVRNARRRSRRSRPGSRRGRSMGPEYTELKALVKREGLHTVCEEAGCPNIYECWEDREATFLIGGDQCTRRCDFCNIDTGKPAAYDTDEPRRVAESVAQMGLRYATVTGVARDDLPDGGAWLYAETVAPDPRRAARASASSCSSPTSTARPRCWPRSSPPGRRCSRTTSRPCRASSSSIRPGFRYERSLDVITPGPRRRPGHQEQPHPRHGRGARGDQPGAAGPARRRLRAHHHHAVPAPVAAAPPGRPAGSSPRSSSSCARRPRRSASPAS